MVREEKIRVVIADDHPVIRKGLCRILQRSPRMEVVGEAKDGQEALRLVEELMPDVLLLDVQMPVLDGIAVIDILQRRGVDILILVLSAIDDPLFRQELLARGACKYIPKEEAIYLAAEIQQAAEQGCDQSSGSKDKQQNETKRPGGKDSPRENRDRRQYAVVY